MSSGKNAILAAKVLWSTNMLPPPMALAIVGKHKNVANTFDKILPIVMRHLLFGQVFVDGQMDESLEAYAAVRVVQSWMVDVGQHYAALLSRRIFLSWS